MSTQLIIFLLSILRTVLFTIRILITHLWADLHIRPPFPFPLPLPHGPARTRLPLRRPANQTQTRQGIGQHLDRAYQAFLPSQLFPSDLKPLLMQPKVCAPQLIHLARDFHTLAFPACARLHSTTSIFQIIAIGTGRRGIASLFSATTGGARISAFGLVARKP